jgi:hypothetical protein
VRLTILRVAGTDEKGDATDSEIIQGRKAYGYRDMDYFGLKIMQVCGYLNSRFIKFPEALGHRRGINELN